MARATQKRSKLAEPEEKEKQMETLGKRAKLNKTSNEAQSPLVTKGKQKSREKRMGKNSVNKGEKRGDINNNATVVQDKSELFRLKESTLRRELV